MTRDIVYFLFDLIIIGGELAVLMLIVGLIAKAAIWGFHVPTTEEHILRLRVQEQTLMNLANDKPVWAPPKPTSAGNTKFDFKITGNTR